MQAHTHSNTPEHTHAQEHCHTHDSHHSHPHGDEGEKPMSPEELTALLSYMVSHNRHHAAELAELSGSVEGAAADALQRAVMSFEEGNRQLETALKLIKE